jgi:hypothetical protein
MPLASRTSGPGHIVLSGRPICDTNGIQSPEAIVNFYVDFRCFILAGDKQVITEGFIISIPILFHGDFPGPTVIRGQSPPCYDGQGSHFCFCLDLSFSGICPPVSHVNRGYASLHIWRTGAQGSSLRFSPCSLVRLAATEYEPIFHPSSTLFDTTITAAVPSSSMSDDFVHVLAGYGHAPMLARRNHLRWKTALKAYLTLCASSAARGLPTRALIDPSPPSDTTDLAEWLISV